MTLHYIGLEKTCLPCLRTTKAQTSMRKALRTLVDITRLAKTKRILGECLLNQVFQARLLECSLRSGGLPRYTEY